jgi:hypothetical protein
LFVFFGGEIASEEDVEVLLVLGVEDWASCWHDAFFWYVLGEIYCLGVFFDVEAGSMIEVLVCAGREVMLLGDVCCRVGGPFLVDTESRI